ncbi:glycerol-3-phosphate responsive antiterminator [Dethiothermospora halolimnae]|uniref:glycerol-3-phosphate responsive antiterminator n=1 Tax=Dethiothermospora halolimnae TaxID=3114390 RepID=UPI003CCBF015
MTNFYSRVHKNPIIAAINDLDRLDNAIKSPCEIIFLLTGNIFNLKNVVDKVRKNDMEIYIHIDLIDGFSKDMIALKYISNNIKPDGIITTKSNLIRIAKSMNIFAIQRLFIVDSLSIETGLKSIHSSKPDAIEVLPGIMPKILKKINNKTNVPIIAGGLIEDKDDVIQCLSADATGISTSREEIWHM